MAQEHDIILEMLRDIPKLGVNASTDKAIIWWYNLSRVKQLEILSEWDVRIYDPRLGILSYKWRPTLGNNPFRRTAFCMSDYFLEIIISVYN